MRDYVEDVSKLAVTSQTGYCEIWKKLFCKNISAQPMTSLHNRNITVFLKVEILKMTDIFI